MLSKLEFEVQKYESDIRDYLIVEENYSKKKRLSNQLITLTIIATIAFLIPTIFKDLLNIDFINRFNLYIADALIYSIISVFFALLSRIFLILAYSLHTKEFSKIVDDASKTSSEMVMDKYKELIEKVNKINFKTEKSIFIYKIFIRLFFLISLLSLILSILLLILCVLNFYGYISRSTFDLLSFFKIITIN